MDNNYCKIGWDGSHLFLLNENNKPIKGQMGIEIENNVNNPSSAKVSLLINLNELIDLRENPKKIKKSLLVRFLNFFNNG